MSNKIVKRNTFKEAFEDVLRLSYEEFINQQITPDLFIQDAFVAFEEMDIAEEIFARQLKIKLIINSNVSHSVVVRDILLFSPKNEVDTRESYFVNNSVDRYSLDNPFNDFSECSPSNDKEAEWLLPHAA